MKRKLFLTFSAISASGLSLIGYLLVSLSYPTDAALDAIYAASSFPIAASALFSISLNCFLPRFFAKIKDSNVNRILNFLNKTLLLIAIFLALVFAFIYMIFDTGRYLTLVYSVVAIVLVQSSIFFSYWQSSGQYLKISLLNIVPSIGIAIGGFLSTVLGTPMTVPAGQFAILFILSACLFLLKKNEKFKKLSFKASCRLIFRRGKFDVALSAFTTLGFVCFQPIDAMYCRDLPDGSLTAISLANRIVVGLCTAIGYGATIMSTKHSVSNGYNDYKSFLQFSHDIQTCLKLSICFVIVLLISILIVFINPYLSIYWGSYNLIFGCLAIMSLSITPLVLATYYLRVLNDLGFYRLTGIFGLFIFFLYLALGFVSVGYFGVYGLALTHAIVWYMAVALIIICSKNIIKCNHGF